MITLYEHDFNTYCLNWDWDDASGVYIFSKAISLDDNEWEHLYIGSAVSFKKRIVTSHKKWDDAIDLGMTHIHAIEESSKHIREWLEEFLIKKFKPPLNIRV